MKKSRYTEEQIVGVLKESEAGLDTAELCHKHGISQQTFYRWKAKYGGLEVSDALRLRHLLSPCPVLADALVHFKTGTPIEAKLYGMLDFHQNPIELVEVRGISKRSRKATDLTVEEFSLIHGLLPAPYRDMVMVAQCTGLRVDELLALAWSAIDFERLSMKVQEGVVSGHIGPVKTEYSEGELPLDPDFAGVLLDLKLKSNGSDLVFPSPKTGHPYHASPIQQDYIRRAGWCLVACPECNAAPGVACKNAERSRSKVHPIPIHEARRRLATEKGFGSIGWQTFRHTYRSLLSGTMTPIDTQQRLLRHADISTTQKIWWPTDGKPASSPQPRGPENPAPKVCPLNSQKWKRAP